MYTIQNRWLATTLAFLLISPVALGQAGGGGSGGSGSGSGGGGRGGAGTAGAGGTAGQGAGGAEQVAGSSIFMGTGGQASTTPGSQAGGAQAVTPAAVATAGIGANGLPRNIRPAPFADADVQRMLNIAPDQLSRLGGADVRLRSDLQSSVRDMNRLGPSAAAVQADELLLHYNSQLMQATADVLTADQMARYRALSHLSEGLYLFTDPDVARVLKLTEEQRSKLKKVQERTADQINNLIKKAGKDVVATQQQAAEIRREAMRDADRILMDTQRKALRQLLGVAVATKPSTSGRQ